jgi:pimeloyl-ACP methyl ester carboxylesterase
MRCATFLLAVSCYAQAQVVTFHSDADDSEQPYALYVPRHADPSHKYPLVLSLHMEETDHLFNLRQIIPPRSEAQFIIACPSARGGMGYRGLAEKDVYDVIADVKRRFAIDEDRIYLTGISTGGGGALWLALTRPDLWAAVAPLCAETPEGIETLAGNALNLPVQLFHGESDPIVPASSSRKWQKRFLDLGVHAEYTEYPGIRHNAWERAYRNGGVLDWFAKFQRERFPARVRFTTTAYKYAAAYWVHLDRLTPGTPAAIDARFTAPNRVVVGTSGLDGFTLNLEGHPNYAERAPLEIEIDGARLRPKGRASLSFVRGERGWISGSAPAPAGVKRAGLEGPMAEAVAARHIYIYGTADSPGEEEIRARREIAELASHWAAARARVQVSFAVKPDRAVSDSDIAEDNLILFGNKETNTLVARFAKQLPIELNASAADYGLVFVVPIGRRYVVVNSGRPWWTGAGQAKRTGPRPAPWRVLDTFGDYILFKGTLERVVAEGRFDRNWKLPPAAAEAMRKTGAVVIPPCCQTSFDDSATR